MDLNPNKPQHIHWFKIEPSYHNVASCKMHVQLHFDSCFLRRFQTCSLLQTFDHKVLETIETGAKISLDIKVYDPIFTLGKFILIILYLTKIIMGKNKFLCWLVGLWCLTTFSTIFQLYRGCHFIGEGNRSTQRKPSTCRKSLTNFIT